MLNDLMQNFLRNFVASAAFILALLFSTTGQAAEDITVLEAGTYTGAYDCNYGRSYSYATLEIFPNSNGSNGRFSFEVGDISGSYFVSIIRSGREFTLTPTQWERQPKGYFYAKAIVYDVGGDLEGRIAAQVCGRLYLIRDRSAKITAQSTQKLKDASFQLLEAKGYYYGTIAPAVFSGLPHPYDEKRGVGHFEQACNGGAVAGCMGLATALKNGRGATEDKPRANALFTEMCNKGFGTACTEIVYAAKTFEYKPGSKVTLSFNGAQEANHKLCFAGNGNAENGKACANLSASLFQQTTRKDVLLYARYVAEHGCALKEKTSCYNAGSFYDNDDSDPGNQNKARALFGTSCNLGYNDGCSEIRARDARDERKNRVVDRRINPMTCVKSESISRTVTEVVTDNSGKADLKEIKYQVPDGSIVRNTCGGDIEITSKLGVTAKIRPERDDFFINLYFVLLSEGDKVVSAKWVPASAK